MGPMDDFDWTVTAFMDDFGGEAVIKVKGASKKDPATGLIATIVESYPVRAILLDLDKTTSGVSQASGTTLQIGDKVCYIKPPQKDGKPYTLPPLDPAKDTVTMGGVEYTIVTLKDRNPSAANSIYLELYLRK
jgi:hypothetical protein